MNIYVDVLLILNLYIDYILLFLCSKICSIKANHIKIIFSSIIGSISTLIILLPNSSNLISFIYSVSVSIILALIFFGKRNLIKNSLVLYILNCLYTGLSMLIWTFFNNSNIIINNNVVYFNISPLLLIISTAIIYLLITLFKKYVFYKNCQSDCSLQIEYDNNSVRLRCLLDTGNLLKDNLTDKPIIIINKKSAFELLNFNFEEYKNLYRLKGYRVIPVSSVNSSSVLTAFSPDRIILYLSDKTVTVNGLVAISNSDITNGFQAIIGAYAVSMGEEAIYA